MGWRVIVGYMENYDEKGSSEFVGTHVSDDVENVLEYLSNFRSFSEARAWIERGIYGGGFSRVFDDDAETIKYQLETPDESRYTPCYMTNFGDYWLIVNNDMSVNFAPCRWEFTGLVGPLSARFIIEDLASHGIIEHFQTLRDKLESQSRMSFESYHNVPPRLIDNNLKLTAGESEVLTAFYRRLYDC